MVHISQFYPVAEVVSGIELCYITELAKYLHYYYKETLSLNGVDIRTSVKPSKCFDYFRVAYNNGWVQDVNFDENELKLTPNNPYTQTNRTITNVLFDTKTVPQESEAILKKRREDSVFAYITPIRKKILFEEQTPDLWVFNSNTKELNGVNNASTIIAGFGSILLLSLCAFVAVNRLKTGYPKKFVLTFSTEHAKEFMALSYFLNICDYTDAFSGWLNYTFTVPELVDSIKASLSYQEWYAYGKELGLAGVWADAKTKKAYLQLLNIEVGDVVCFYERNKGAETDLVKSISSFKMAVVEDITDKGMKFRLIHTTAPKIHRMISYANNTMAIKALYNDIKPYEKLSETIKFYEYMDFGVNYMLYDELAFITPITDDDEQTFYIDKYKKQVTISAQDTIYWILKDYNVPFNEQKFIEEYLNNEKPAYTKYMCGEL